MLCVLRSHCHLLRNTFCESLIAFWEGPGGRQLRPKICPESYFRLRPIEPIATDLLARIEQLLLSLLLFHVVGTPTLNQRGHPHLFVSAVLRRVLHKCLPFGLRILAQDQTDAGL